MQGFRSSGTFAEKYVTAVKKKRKPGKGVAPFIRISFINLKLLT